MTTLVVCPTFFELAPFFDCDVEVEEKYFSQPGASLFVGKVRQNKVDILISGPGIFNCSFALASYMSLKRPSRIFQLGIAGVFEKSGLDVGDIVVSTGVQYLHTGVEKKGQSPLPLPFELIKGFPETSFGKYHPDPVIGKISLESLQTTKAAMPNKNFQVVEGKIITVSMITGNLVRASAIKNEFSPLMEAMEGAAAAHAATLYGIPMVEIRAGSNIAGERNKARWNIPLASKRISWVLDCLMQINHWG